MFTKEYVERAKSEIDDVFGLGFSSKHPGLVGDCVKAYAMEQAAESIAASLEEFIRVYDNAQVFGTFKPIKRKPNEKQWAKGDR